MTPLSIALKKTPPGRSRIGHPWIFRSQIQSIPTELTPGTIVDVYSHGKRFLGRGYLNPRSEITVRLLTKQPQAIDASFFREKISKAVAFRKKFVKDTNAMRLVSSESDDLPGLIVDQYGEVLIVQFLTLGMEVLRDVILSVLKELLPVKGIYEKSDSGSRKLEGLSERTGWIEQSCGAEQIVQEADVRFSVPLGAGHKTGLYLDQRENRIALKEWAKPGMRVLDGFCYTGGFGLHLAKMGCEVLGVDAQEEAIRLAESNRMLNGLTEKELSFKTANCFDELKALEQGKQKFNLVILDPPSFVKRKDAVESALSGFKEIILRSMRILAPDGLLAVFSCSYHIDDNLLMRTAMSAAFDTKREIKLIRFMKQSVDHPINPFIPETYYLKGFLFCVNASI